jgi:hypothetical protein
MTKNKIILTSTILILTITAILLAIIPVYTTPKANIIDEINDGVKLSGNGNTKIVGGWNGYFKDNQNAEIVISSFNVIHPVYSLVYTFTEKSTYIQIISLTRKNVFDFKVDDYIIVEVKKPFKEAVSLAQKYDLSKENPDPENITVFPPLKPSSSPETVVYPQGVTMPD